MAIKITTSQDGIFKKSQISYSHKDTLDKEDIEVLIKASSDIAKSNMTKHIMENFESKARAILEAPQSQSRNKNVREADERQRRDAEKY